VPDYKIPPKPEPIKRSTVLAVLALVIILALGYLFWSGKIKLPKSAPKPTASQQANDQQKEAVRQQVFSQQLIQNGYTSALPQDLVLDPQAHATTTVTANKKTGVTTSAVTYVENRPFSQVLQVYPPALQASGWTVAPADPKNPLVIQVSKNGFSASITVVPYGLNNSQVTIQFTSKN
jgi:hypothetical protein